MAEVRCQQPEGLQRIARGVEQGAHPGIGPKPYFAGAGLEHGFIAAVRVGGRARTEFEQRRLHGPGIEAGQREFDFVERHRRAADAGLTSVPGAAPGNGCRCRLGGMPND